MIRTQANEFYMNYNKIIVEENQLMLKVSKTGYMYLAAKLILEDGNLMSCKKFLGKYSSVVHTLLSEGYLPGTIIENWLNDRK